MVILSPRLAAVASLVRRGSCVADIGCDHGFLPVWLVQSGAVSRAVAADINKGPLDSCKRLIEESGLADNISCVISDGLSAVEITPDTDVCICGVGGELAASMLDKCKMSKTAGVHYIFNPMTRPEALRRYLCENGFEIEKDFIVCEGERRYNIFDAYYTGKAQIKDESFYYLGNITDFSEKEYFLGLIRSLKKKERGGGDFSDVIKDIEARL